MNEQEIEVKLYLAHPQQLAKRLESLRAVLVQPRILETNLRFDTPEGALGQAGRVLRLRRDQGSVLTFKGRAQIGQSASMRQEIEFHVDDFTAARRFLECLGYQVQVIYEKYRTTWRLGTVLVTVDEMPYGVFSEIEGPDADQLEQAAGALGLDWERRILESYLAIFGRLRQQNSLAAQNLTFAEFSGLTFTAQELGFLPADED